MRVDDTTCYILVGIFFFKQKTAYEMRISDWSSDVCSSDLVVLFKPLTRKEIRKIVDIQLRHVQKMLTQKEITLDVDDEAKDWLAKLGYDVSYGARKLGRASCRERVCQYV